MRKSRDVEDEIEKARKELNDALSDRSDIKDCYDKSVKLDLLIEEYLANKENVSISEY